MHCVLISEANQPDYSFKALTPVNLTLTSSWNISNVGKEIVCGGGNKNKIKRRINLHAHEYVRQNSFTG